MRSVKIACDKSCILIKKLLRQEVSPQNSKVIPKCNCFLHSHHCWNAIILSLATVTLQILDFVILIFSTRVFVIEDSVVQRDLLKIWSLISWNRLKKHVIATWICIEVPFSDIWRMQSQKAFRGQTPNFTHFARNQTHPRNFCLLESPGSQFTSFHSLF